MIARKGLDLLLAAFSRLVETGARVRLLLVGREAESSSELARLSAAVRERVSFEGFQPPEDLPRFFARADAFVLPSRHDGWGVVVNQALGAGLPLLCSDAVGAACDLIEPGVNGAVCEAGNVDALFREMQRLSAAPQLAAQWGEASRRKAHEWTPDRGAEKWLRVLDEVLAR